MRPSDKSSEGKAQPADAQRTIEAWRIDYETERPHSRLKDLTPREFAQALAMAPSSLTPTTGPS